MWWLWYFGLQKHTQTILTFTHDSTSPSPYIHLLTMICSHDSTSPSTQWALMWSLMSVLRAFSWEEEIDKINLIACLYVAMTILPQISRAYNYRVNLIINSYTISTLHTRLVRRPSRKTEPNQVTNHIARYRYRIARKFRGAEFSLFSWVSNPTRNLSPRKLLAITCKD